MNATSVAKDERDNDSQSVLSDYSDPLHSVSQDDGDSTSSAPSSSFQTSTSNSGRNTHRGIPEAIITTKETKAVNCSRLLVLSVLVVSAIATGVMTFQLAKSSEKQDFEVQFEDFAAEIEDVSHQKASNVFLAVKSFAATITSYALATDGVAWPNVTLPHFEKHGELLQLSTGAQAIAFSPLVVATQNSNASSSNGVVDQWNQYSVENQGWIQESYELRDDPHPARPIPSQMYRRLKDGTVVAEEDGGVDIMMEYCPLWQESEAPEDTSVINFNLMSHEVFARVFRLMRDTRGPVLSEVLDVSELFGYTAILETDDGTIHPESFLAEPVYDDFDETNVVATVSAVIPWDTYFEDLLHEGAYGILCVLRDTCGDVFTYQIDGPTAHYIDEGDLHNPKYDYLEHTVAFGPRVDFTHADDDAENGHCDYTIHLYPTDEFENNYYTSKPLIFTIVVVVVFIFTSLVFIGYDFLVQKRQAKVHDYAVKSNAIVSSLFPAEIRDRLFEQQNEAENNKISSGNKNNKSHHEIPGGSVVSGKHRLKNYLHEDADTKQGSSGDTNEKEQNRLLCPEMYGSKPIADLFPNTTVMFADIVGFTAWSSVREPSQVFTLLETVYRAFDTIAKRRRVFKVETVGDCYVAVTGLPTARNDHAVLMARFARDCLAKMNELASKLEVMLGPDTGDLGMRIGLHSGPVTAGVLRGDKSRFQLFGDTVNTASRIEGTGMRDRIQISEDTATLLIEAGKGKWCTPRTDLVHAKGKGSMKTFWLVTKERRDSDATGYASGMSTASGYSGTSLDLSDFGHENHDQFFKSSIIPSQIEVSPKMIRLVDWNVEILKRLLQQIVKTRVLKKGAFKRKNFSRAEQGILHQDGMVLDEVAEIITLPKFDAKIQNRSEGGVDIPETVLEQLRQFVESIACTYRDNPFHNFEHASHVTMSVSKLLSRIVAPDIEVNEANLAADLHDHTYGITSDPLTQFAVVISALIHDADHVGIPNFLLIKENDRLAEIYNQKSVAEQNSVDLAWEMLMRPQFAELRSYIYTDVEELKRFRQLLVNTVLATDIFDKELSTLRKARWAKAFSPESSESEDSDEAKNRKATIVIEHLIQASDVAHTMQHWHIYTKWNERLFAEMYTAYKTGRSDKDPSEGWVAGEIGFFDGYVIPLAKKLKDCGVFGVSSDEYLNYALENRREWERKGPELVAELIEKYG